MKKRTQEAEEFFKDEEEETSHVEKDSDQSDEEYDPSTALNEDKSPAKPNEDAPNTDENCSTTAPLLEQDNTLEMPTETAPAEIMECEHVNDIADQSTSNHKQPAESTEIIELHTVRTELDDELDGIKTNDEKIPKLSIPTDYVPKLKGDKGFIIDFETNDLKPAPKTGVDELLSRFIKNALVKSNEAETQDVGLV